MTVEEQVHEEPYGIGGWLTLRVLQLTLISPTWMLILFVKGAHGAWYYVSLAVVALGFACGVLLLLHRPLGLATSGVHLVILAVYALYIGYNDIHSKTIRHLGPVLTIVVADIAMYLAWFLYFRLSLRVRNTFGRNL
jgi:hypothetical protein